MSVAELPESRDGITIPTHGAQRANDRGITRDIIDATLENGEARHVTGDKYVVEYDDDLTTATYVLKLIKDGGEWVLKTAYPEGELPL